MKKHILIPIFLLLVLASSVRAERYHFSGGGFSFGIHNVDLGFLDNEFQRFTPGFKKIEGHLMLFGGFGYGEVDDGIRIGGYGFGGGTTISGIIPNSNQIRQDVSIEVSAGGFLVEYVPLHMFRRFEVDLDLGLGLGGADITIDQFGPNVTWEDMMGSLDPDSADSRQTFSMTMTQGFFMVEPALILKYYINSFMAIEGRAGYLLIVGMGDWQFRDVKILDMPDVDLSAPVLGLRVTFGG